MVILFLLLGYTIEYIHIEPKNMDMLKKQTDGVCQSHTEPPEGGPNGQRCNHLSNKINYLILNYKKYP